MKKMITKTLVIIFSIGILITVVLNFSLQIYKDIENFHKISSEYFLQMENLTVDVGLEPDKALQALKGEDNFEALSADFDERESTLYAIDAKTDMILGSTNKKYIGKKVKEIKLNVSDASEEVTSGYQKLKSGSEYCVMKQADSLILVHSCTSYELFRGIGTHMLVICMYLLVVFFVLMIMSSVFFDRKIVRTINNINNDLKQIEQGNWDIVLSECTLEEFAELNNHIKSMVNSLLSFPSKMSKALERSKIPIGICEYEPEISRVTATSRVKDILLFTDEEYKSFIGNPREYEVNKKNLFIEEPGLEENVYRLNNEVERFIRVESFLYKSSRMMVLIDVTPEVQTKRKIIKERDTDLLTGLYNRRAFEEQLDLLYSVPELRKDSMIVMFDLDHLKYVNDKYGHADGDRYLLTFSELLHRCDFNYKIAARLGGDEFMLFVFGLNGIQDTDSVIKKLESFQDRYMVMMENGEEIMLEFSMGWAFSPKADASYQELIQLADAKMYAEKKQRKAARV